MAIATGLAKWAKVHNAAPNYNKDGYEWTIDLYTDKAETAKLKEIGLKPKFTDDGEAFFKFKQPTKTKAGKECDAPVVVDRDNMPFTKDIGNGSKVRVQYRTYEYAPNKLTAYLQGVQVLELVEYEGSNRAGAEFSAVSEEESQF